MTQYKRKPHKHKKKKPIYKYRWFWLAPLFLILGYALFYTLFLASFFQVKEIKVNGLEKISGEELELAIRLKLEHKLLKLPHRNIFLVKLRKVKEDILEEYPLLESISIKRYLPSSLKVVVEERQALASFCATETCFALDKHGVVFKVIDKTNLITKIIIPEAQVSLGETVIDPEELTQILEIASYLKETLELEVEEILIQASEKLNVKMIEGWEVYFNLKENVNWQLVKLQILLSEKISLSERRKLEWIELRYGNFANPKYKD